MSGETWHPPPLWNPCSAHPSPSGGLSHNRLVSVSHLWSQHPITLPAWGPLMQHSRWVGEAFLYSVLGGLGKVQNEDTSRSALCHTVAPDLCSRFPHLLWQGWLPTASGQALLSGASRDHFPPRTDDSLPPHTPRLLTPALISISTQNKAQPPQGGSQGPSRWQPLSSSTWASTLYAASWVCQGQRWSRGCKNLRTCNLCLLISLPGLLFLAPPPSHIWVEIHPSGTLSWLTHSF